MTATADPPVPGAPPFGSILRADAERLLAERVCALTALAEHIEDEAAGVIALATNPDRKTVDARALAVRLSALEEEAARLAPVAARVPDADLRAAIERARRAGHG